jgi:prepilin-type N-terminal cleavage/methylation domain-containing protein
MRNSNENASGRTTVTARRNRCAFTLVEIICVVVILAIAALIAIPAFSGASQMQVKAAADKLAADLEYAKSLAVTAQKNHKVVFDTNLESYSIWINSSGTTWTLIKDPVKKCDFKVTYPQDSRLSQVGIQSTTFVGSTVQFDYTGTPLDGSGNAITTGHNTVKLAAKGLTFTINVEPVTGYISITQP